MAFQTEKRKKSLTTNFQYQTVSVRRSVKILIHYSSIELYFLTKKKIGFVVTETNVFDKTYIFSVQGWYWDKGCYQCRKVQSHSLESLIVGKSWKVRMILECWQNLRLYSIKSGWIQWVRIVSWMIMTSKEESTYIKTPSDCHFVQWENCTPMHKGGHYILLRISKTMTRKPVNEADLLHTHPWQYYEDKHISTAKKLPRNIDSL